MIKPTDEMEQAMLYGGTPRERLTAVIAIIERDYYVGERIPLHCGEPGPEELTCQRTPKHLTAHAASSPGNPGEMVVW